MTLSQIVDHVTGKLEQQDETSRARARAFALARYRMIWEGTLWRESMLPYTVTAKTGEAMVYLPPEPPVDHVAAVAAGSAEIGVTSLVEQLRADPESYTRLGKPQQFANMGRSELGYRIRLFNTPEADTELLVVAKQAHLADPGDDDTPVIPGVVSAVLAFTEADMLERRHQYAKAQAKLSEAGALLQSAIEAQSQQGASSHRLIPESGGHWSARDWQ